jgi:hypothetical protein
MKKILHLIAKTLKKPIKIIISDKQIKLFGVIIGFSMFFYGLYIIHPSLAFIPGGLIIMYVFWPDWKRVKYN